MSAKILDFPGAPSRLQVEGFTLIAWGRDLLDDLHPGRLRGLWRQNDGGWYRSGFYNTPRVGGNTPGRLETTRIGRSAAIRDWSDDNYRHPHEWHYLVSEAQAFPEKRRQYVRPPRARVPAMA